MWVFHILKFLFCRHEKIICYRRRIKLSIPWGYTKNSEIEKLKTGSKISESVVLNMAHFVRTQSRS